jgi:predicted RNA-binding Zn-ribbon protein involved in translation (DUF1610 family)
MTAAAKKNKSGFYIEVTCPGCGGALDLESDFFVLRCRHCGSVHRIVMPDIPATYLVPARVDKRQARFNIDRFLKKRSLPLSGSGMHLKQLYYPYWKIDAVLFRLRNKVYERVIMEETEYNEAVTGSHDRTEINLSPYTTTRAAGIPFAGIPVTVGMRTEYIKMVPYAQENVEDEFDSLPALSSWEDIRKDLLVNVGLIADIDESRFGSNVTQLFHPRASLVYFPFLVLESYTQGGFNRYVVDGVSGRVLNHVTEIDRESEFEYPDSPAVEFGALRVEHHRCSNCGVDLPDQQSYIYICHNCQEVIVLGNGSAVIGELYLASGGARADSRMFPFWSFGIPEAGASRLRTMFGGIHGSDRLLIPAFKTRNFDAILRLAKRMSSAISQMELKAVEKLDNRYRSVGVSLDEALLMSEILIYHQGFSRPGSAAPVEENFIPEDIQLVYVPFHPEHYFYVDSVMNTLTFEKSLAR